MRLTIISDSQIAKKKIEARSMSASQIALLGGFAGFTIFFLGLPIGRLRAPMPNLKTALNAVAIGILVFLLWDVLAHAWEPVDRALAAKQIGHALVNGALLAATFGTGLSGWYGSMDGEGEAGQPTRSPLHQRMLAARRKKQRTQGGWRS